MVKWRKYILDNYFMFATYALKLDERSLIVFSRNWLTELNALENKLLEMRLNISDVIAEKNLKEN